MKPAWLSNSRSDCLFEISQLAQVTEEIFDQIGAEIKRHLNRAVEYSIENMVRLKIDKLDEDTLRIIRFHDSSYADNEDFCSQL